MNGCRNRIRINGKLLQNVMYYCEIFLIVQAAYMLSKFVQRNFRIQVPVISITLIIKTTILLQVLLGCCDSDGLFIIETGYIRNNDVEILHASEMIYHINHSQFDIPSPSKLPHGTNNCNFPYYFQQMRHFHYRNT